jgi:hypothetical protein
VVCAGCGVLITVFFFSRNWQWVIGAVVAKFDDIYHAYLWERKKVESHKFSGQFFGCRPLDASSPRHYCQHGIIKAICEKC